MQYETLTTDPAKAMQAIYAFLGEPVFEHDFGHVDYDVTEFDERAGTPGLHTVRRTVNAEPRDTLLPPDLFNRSIRDAFWRDPQRIPAGLRSVRSSQSLAQRCDVALGAFGDATATRRLAQGCRSVANGNRGPDFPWAVVSNRTQQVAPWMNREPRYGRSPLRADDGEAPALRRQGGRAGASLLVRRVVCAVRTG